MTDLEKFHYKEKRPDETVALLTSILKKIDVEVEEIIPYHSEIETHSLRVVFKGTSIGTNGKGINECFCRASAYGELFERLENDYLNIYPYDTNDGVPFIKCPDERKLTAAELIAQKDEFLGYYFSVKKMKDSSDSEKEAAFKKIIHSPYGDTYLSLPFYSVRQKKVQYLPYNLYSLAYGSNGMVAGNTPYEAIVQGLSEILERIVQKELIISPQSLPTIPDDYIKKYPYIYERYKKAQAIDGVKVVMKDCTLNGRYPVAGLLIVIENTGKYGLKLGCHPNFAVAMERTLTEATQGGSIKEYAERSWIDLSNNSVKDKNNIMNSFATGLCQYPYQIVEDWGMNSYAHYVDKGSLTNEEYAKRMITNLIDDGYDVLIRDVSWLGFPAYHIIVPGLSEALDVTDDFIKAHNTVLYARRALENLNNISEEDCKYIIAAIGYFKGNLLIDNMKSFFPDTFKLLPYNGVFATRYLAALCDVRCGNYHKALNKLVVVQSTIEKSLSKQDQERFHAERLYLSAYIVFQSHDKVMKYLKLLLSSDMYDLIDYLYCDRYTILKKVFQINNNHENKEKRTLCDITYKLRTEMCKSNIDQNDLSKLF